MSDPFPVSLTARSAKKVKEYAVAQGRPPSETYVRAYIKENGNPGLALDNSVDPTMDVVGESFGIQVVIARHDARALNGFKIDYRSVGPEMGFILRDPESLHSLASDPGNIRLSEEKLRYLQPELFPRRKGIFARLLGSTDDDSLAEYREALAEYLHMGDSRAAVVVATEPLVIAAYTDEIDCVALLEFPSDLVSRYQLSAGRRMLTINTYPLSSANHPPTDLIAGENALGRYENFSPNIAEFLTDDLERVELRKRRISEREWQRATELGQRRLADGVRPRDGRPLYSAVARWPATGP